MFYNVLKYEGDTAAPAKEEDVSPDKAKALLNEDAKSASKQRIMSLKNKIRSIGKMAKILKTLRQENENITKLKGLCPGYKIPPGIISEGTDAIQEAMAQFEKAKKMDRINEGMPEEMKISSDQDE